MFGTGSSPADASSPQYIARGATFVRCPRGHGLGGGRARDGGELAPLAQVLWTLDSFTPPGSRPSAAGFAASTALLVELGVVEYLEDQLGLTPEGRKLLRRSGMPNDARHVVIVTELLQEFDEDDLETDGSLIVPTESDVAHALSEEDGIGEPDDGMAPVVGQETLNYSPILGLGSPGIVFGAPRVPAVPPKDSDRATEPPRSVPLEVSPAHPLLNRLFGRGETATSRRLTTATESTERGRDAGNAADRDLRAHRESD